MIVNEQISSYINSLNTDMPEYLMKLEKQALIDEVPIIRKDAQNFLRFLLKVKKPKRILEVGTAVGFSGSLLSEYMPEDCTITTIEKVPIRVVEAKKNLSNAPKADKITLLIGDAMDVLRALNGKAEGSFEEIYYPGTRQSVKGQGSTSDVENVCDELPEELKQPYDFIFMDAAKGQYMNFLPEIMELLPLEGMFITDNVLQEGSIAGSKYSVIRRDRTIHTRMREYLYTLTHSDELDTVVLPVGDGITLCTRIKKEEL